MAKNSSGKRAARRTDAKPKRRPVESYDHLDPQFVWAGKAEHTSFEVPTVSLHVHERIDPRTIIEAVRKRNAERGNGQMLLFEQPDENPWLVRFATRMVPINRRSMPTRY